MGLLLTSQELSSTSAIQKWPNTIRISFSKCFDCLPPQLVPPLLVSSLYSSPKKANLRHSTPITCPCFNPFPWHAALHYINFLSKRTNTPMAELYPRKPSPNLLAFQCINVPFTKSLLLSRMKNLGVAQSCLQEPLCWICSLAKGTKWSNQYRLDPMPTHIIYHLHLFTNNMPWTLNKQ